ncbi:hypothetical protein VNO77_09076 [Canavalia gladiata]|uniref:beta-ketoacyl-[acyl-carrier-protein] synthase I n=1 Tax=Canavalia gladiata TaxID=3824 RepID=A0AAN9QU14_CANGL
MRGHMGRWGDREGGWDKYVIQVRNLEHAMKRGAPIVAEYLGGAANRDAYHMTNPRSDGLGVPSCVQSSLEDVGMSPEEVNYINAPTSSTVAGNLQRSMLVGKVFKDT